MPKFKYLIIALFAACSSAAAETDPAFEQENEQAKQACIRGDTPAAVKIWQKWAEKGVARAQSNIGFAYMYGCKASPENAEDITNPDREKARPWLEKAATAGVPQARYLLAVYLAHYGRDAADRRRAAELLRQQLQNDDAVRPDLEGGIKKILQDLEEQGRIAGKYGEAFAREHTVAQGVCAAHDYQAAIKIWQKWADKGNARAQADLGRVYLHGCTSPYNPKGRPELDPSKALPLLESAAKAGDIQGRYYLGEWLTGDGHPEKERLRGMKIMEQAAEQGHIQAQHDLAYLYLTLGNQNLEKYYYWTRKAAEQGNADSQRRLAIGLDEGKYLKRDCKQAEGWIRRAAEQNDGETYKLLVHWYQNGSACFKKDAAEAAKWQQKVDEYHEKFSDALHKEINGETH